MKHLLNNLSNEEKNSILEQHTGGMKVITENFSKLIGAKHGDSKPLVKEQEEENYDEARKDYNWFERDEIAPEDLEKVLSNNNKKYSDKEWKLNDLKKRFTSPILNANSEEEIMDAIMNMAELASYRKTQPFVNEQEEENYDDDFFYKAKPNQSYYYDKDDNVSDIDNDMDMDTEEWGEDDFDTFHEKYPYGERQKTFPNTEDGKRWFKGYSQVHGGKFPVYKRKK